MPQTRDNQGRARLAVIALAATLVVEAATATLNVMLLMALRGADVPGLQGLAGVEQGLTIASIACWLLTALVFVLWLYRAFGNALAMGERSQWCQWCAIVSWIVPILQWVVPLQIVATIRRNAVAMAGRHMSAGLAVCWWLSCCPGGWATWLHELAAPWWSGATWPWKWPGE
jgi:hypothetical protein